LRRHHLRVHEHEARRTAYLDRIRSLAESLPADAVMSHESAAAVLGYPVYSLPPAVKVTRTRGRGVRTSDVHVHVAQLRERDVTTVGGIRVTSGARTVVDLGRRLPFRQSLVVADAAVRRGVRRTQLHDVLRHQWTWPRIRAAMLAVRHAHPKAETALESVVRSRLIELSLPVPELQVNVHGRFGWIARVDFEFTAYGLVGEADGRIKYTDDELWAEKLRQEAIEDAEREVIRWTWAQAHVPDADFARRTWRYLNRALVLRSLRAAG
jgi:hypothetical protein